MAQSIRSRGAADARTSTHGDIDGFDELTEAEPRAAEGKRWRLRAWLRSSNH
jgi:hypothetical protein